MNIALEFYRQRAARKPQPRVRVAKVLPQPHVPLAIVRAHVMELAAMGFSCTQIAEAAGVTRRTVLYIRSGKPAYVRPAVASKLLSLEPMASVTTVLGRRAR